MTKINPLSIKIEGLDLKLGNIEPFVAAEKRITVAQRNQITRYISDYISEEIGLGRKMSSGTMSKYLTPQAAPDGQIDTEQFFNLTGIKVSQSSVLKDEAQQATFETKVGKVGGDVSFTAIDVGGKTNKPGFEAISKASQDFGTSYISGIKAYQFLEKAPEVAEEFKRLKGSLTQKMENLLLVKIVDADKGKGKRTELSFIKNPLKGLDFNNPTTFTNFISLRIRPRTKSVNGSSEKTVTAYRIEAKATSKLLKSFDSKRITDKVIKAHSNAYSTGLQKYVFSRLDKFVKRSKTRPNNEQIRAVAAYTVALAREFEAGGQTPLATKTGVRKPNLNIKPGELRVIPTKKRERQSFISGVQLTQLVQRRLGKTMRKFGEPQAPELTERSGRFRTSVEVIANYRKNVVAYRYNPIYDNLDKYGYKPSEQVGKATREVVQTLFARAFSIVKG